MKNKITKCTTAAAVVVLIVGLIATLWPEAGIATRAYAMSDVPGLLNAATTIHIQGWAFFPDQTDPNQEYRKILLEYWFDTQNGRMRLHKPKYSPSQDGPMYHDTISDGKYKMETSYRKPVGGKWTPVIRFTKLTPFQSRLLAHQSAVGLMRQIFGNLDQVEGFTKSGVEEISGTMFDIWEGEVFTIDGHGLRIKTWLCPSSGKLGRVLLWQKKEKQDSEWQPVIDLYKIERNTEPPAGVFKTEPPDGVELENTKETAPTAILGGVGGHGRAYIGIHIGFTLNDGSVIVGWSVGAIGGSQSDVFSDLSVGGPLPELAARITGLKAFPSKEHVVYEGHHLAYTQKDNKFYEWSLYIPEKKSPPRSALFGYEVLIEFNVDKSRFGSWANNLREDLLINTREDFDRWVLAAMGELSDDGIVPNHVTYENVMRLAEEIRQSLENR